MALSKILNASVTDSTLTTTKLATPNLGRRNLVINGAMQVAQRGTSFTSQTADHYFVDRFKLGATSLGTWTTSQSTDAPDGFAYSAKIECTTADASPASSDFLYFYSRFEGQNLQQLKFGTSNAESVSISFYVKCSKTGVFTVNWRNQDAGKAIGSNVTINSANTWEYKTITFVGDTSNAFNNDNGWSANLEFILNGGTDYTSGNTPTSYASVSNTDGTRGGGTTLALGANAGETIQFAGVQLEANSQATPFEHRSYGEELVLCERYFQLFSNGARSHACTGIFSASTTSRIFLVFRNIMRANPSLTGFNLLICTDRIQVDLDVSALVIFDGNSTSNSTLQATHASGATYARPSFLQGKAGQATSYLHMDSEL
jgi:hypothetical protein